MHPTPRTPLRHPALEDPPPLHPRAKLILTGFSRLLENFLDFYRKFSIFGFRILAVATRDKVLKPLFSRYKKILDHNSRPEWQT
jgi:hypothetical protein